MGTEEEVANAAGFEGAGGLKEFKFEENTAGGRGLVGALWRRTWEE